MMRNRDEEKEMIEDYEVKSSVWIDGKRIVFGINEENKEKPRFISCIILDNGIFGRYEGIASDDYFEAIKHYADNIKAEAVILETEKRAIPLEDISCLEAKDLIPCDWEDSIKETVVAIKPQSLSEGRRNISNQLFYIDGGFGAEAKSRGSACYGWDLYSRSRVRIERSYVMGIVPESLLPPYAKKTLSDICKGVLKEEYDTKIKKKAEVER